MSSYAALYMADTSPQNILLNSYCGVAALVLLVYEHTITFAKEVYLFWNGNMSRASALFFFNRYLALVAIALPRLTMQRMQSERSYRNAFIMCLWFAYIFPRCKVLAYAFETLDILALLPWAILSSLRAFALSEAPYRWMVTSLVLGLALVPFGVNLTQFHWLTPVNSELECLAKLSVTANMGKKWLYVSSDRDMGCALSSLTTAYPVTVICRICTILSDLIVLGVAVNATYKTSRLVRRAIGYRNSPNSHTFTETILRDGAIYFVGFLLLNVAHLVFTWLSLSIDSLSAVSFLTIFTQPLAAILISRFLLNLQEVKQRLAGPRSLPHITSIGTIHLRPLGPSQEPGGVEGDSLPAVHGTGDADVWPAAAEIEDVYHADG